MTSPRETGTPLAALNPEQAEAARHGEGPLLVIAGAGTGKTRTLAARVSDLISRGCAPERILLLTFTRQAAREMLSRAGVASRKGIWGGTFHAVAHRLLRIYAEPMGLEPGFTVIDRPDAEDLMDLSRSALGLKSAEHPTFAGERGGAPRNARFPGKGTCVAIYSRCVNEALDGTGSSDRTLEQLVLERFPWVSGHEAALKRLFKEYEARKQAQSVLDLDDLLVWWRGLQEDERLGRDVEERFDHVLVDEYQDTNRLQRAILLSLRKHNRNLTVVGDDAQAIYGCHEKTLRSESGETGAVGCVGRPSSPPPPRPAIVRARDERSQAEHVIRSSLRLLEDGIALRKQAVLFRAAHHSDLLEVELSRRKIPYRKFGGLRFLEAAHVKDVLALLRIVENPRDETAWWRILKLLEGFGPKTARRALDHLAREGFSPASLERFQPPKNAEASWSALRGLLVPLSGDAELSVTATIERVRAFYDPVLARRYDHAPARSQDLDALARIAQAAPSRRDFLAEVTLDPPSSTSDLAGPPHLDDDWLVLSTIHSAKGLEWDAVTVLNAVDGCIPSDLATGRADEIEEERRVFYVALSRARRFLTVVAPLRFHLRDKGVTDRHGYAQLTRFLPESVLLHFDRVPDGEPDEPDSPATVSAADSLRARALKRWD
ncbi:ATP-dependent helicase [bacterium]|nr:ATP-dependent helicase [bacterium]